MTNLMLLLLCSTDLATAYDFDAEYTGDMLINASGGIKTGGRYLDNLDLSLEIDIAEAWGTGSGNVLISGLYNNGGTFSGELVGDLQVVSNIDTAEAWRIYEFWYELGDDIRSIKAGLYDLNSEFDVNEAGSIFLNSSHGIGADLGQTGMNGPGVFPVTSMAMRGALRLGKVTARLVVMDAVPGDPDNLASNRIDIQGNDGFLAVTELDAPLSDSARLWSGYWRYSADFEHSFGIGASSGNDGWYVGYEQAVTLGSRSAAWFIRVGGADERFNALQGYAGFGVVIDGLIPARPADQFGIAVASARAGRPYRIYLDEIGAGAKHHETAIEMTYRAQINDRLVLQPDIQYVQNPSATRNLENAWVVGLRFVVSATD